MAAGPASTTLSRLAARRALALGRGDLPPAVRAKVLLCLRDFIACCFTALDGPAGAAIVAAARARPGAPEAFHWGLPHPVSAECAALGNAMLGHGLIREDMHVRSGAHAGVTILPALLAQAQRDRWTGQALMRGIVAGYQVMTALGTAVRTGLTNRHFRPIGISGAFGATAGAIAATQPDEDTAVNALGFAANFAAGLNQWPWSGGQEIYVHPGMAARNSLVAMDLARAGLRSSADVLEGADGLFAAYGSGAGAAERFRQDLEAGFAILEVRHKPVAGCNMILTPVAAALGLRRRIGAARIAEIRKLALSTFAAARRYPGCDYAGPFTSIQQSKMSLQYGIAAALRFGALDDAAYTSFSDAELQRLVAACEIRVLPAFDAAYPASQPAIVEAQLNDGEIVRSELADVPWLDERQVTERFEHDVAARSCAAGLDGIKAALASLWELADAGDLATALREAADQPRAPIRKRTQEKHP